MYGIISAANWEVSPHIYGIRWDRTHAAPEVTRVGNMDNHRDLPIQSRIGRGVFQDSGFANYYLDPNDSSKVEEDGRSAFLDGRDGQVMVGIPKYYVKYWTIGNICWVWFSKVSVPGFTKVERFFVGAFKASLNRDTLQLSSVVSDSPTYRGGNNNAAWDSQANTLIGKPATAISRNNFDIYATNRGARYHNISYNQRKALYWLITCEFATRNHQAAFDPTLTEEGFRQGGLGSGATNISSAEWTTFNSQYPAINCGQTIDLGNNTGVKKVTLNNFPTTGETRTTEVNSYRGIESFYGDIWGWTSGMDFIFENGVAHAWVSDSGLNESHESYRYVGELVSAAGYISDIVFGEYGDILPGKTTGGSSTTFYCDYYYHSSGDGLRALRSGGALNYGAIAGSACAHSNGAPSNTYASIGSRLCFS